jgi:hypothetical protein
VTNTGRHDPAAANLDLPIERALNGSMLVGLVPEVVFGLMASDAVDQFFSDSNTKRRDSA